jgi:hypothetical protein
MANYSDYTIEVVRNAGGAGASISTFPLSQLVDDIGALHGVGYKPGSGGAVTQATSKATAVTLNTATGEITLNNASLAAATIVSFTLNDSKITATDMIAATHHSGGTLGAYTVNACATGAGTATVAIRNNTAGALAEAIVIKFAIIKAPNS